MEVVVGHHNGVTSAASFGDSHCVNGIDPQPLQRGVLGAKRAPQMVIDRRESTQSYRLCRARTTDSNIVRGSWAQQRPPEGGTPGQIRKSEGFAGLTGMHGRAIRVPRMGKGDRSGARQVRWNASGQVWKNG